MKILITGASGFLGSKVQAVFAGCQDWEVWSLSRSASTGAERAVAVDITDEGATAGLLAELAPDALIHCAAISSSDACEREPDRARAVNVWGTLALARHAPGHFVLISTDYVFDGLRGRYSETDEPRPVNLYGRIKLEAEEMVQKHCRQHTIARVSGLYGYNRWGNNRFVDALLAGVARAPVDLLSSPTLVDDVAAVLAEMVRQGQTGLYHVAGPEPRSRYSFLSEAAVALGAPQPMPTMARNMDYLAPRPRDSSLISIKLDHRLSDVGDGLWQTREAMRASKALPGSV